MTNNLGITKRVAPKPLKKGDKIALVTPARFATSSLIDESCKILSKAGFTPHISEGLNSREGQFGGDDQSRANQLNLAFQDPEIRAVLALRGGYGSARLLTLLDVESYMNDPT